MDKTLRELIKACEGPACPDPLLGRAVGVFGRYFNGKVPGLTVETEREEFAYFIGDCPFCGESKAWEADILSGSWSCRGCTGDAQGFDVFVNRISPELLSEAEALALADRIVAPVFRGPGR